MTQPAKLRLVCRLSRETGLSLLMRFHLATEQRALQYRVNVYSRIIEAQSLLLTYRHLDSCS